jgi:HEAT repeat protein
LYIHVGVFCIFLLLSSAACSERVEERIDTIYAAKAVPSEENVELIRGFLDDPDRDVRATAVNSLVSLDVPDAVPIALNALEDPDGFVRSIGAMRLGDVGDSRHASVLARHLREDSDGIVRQRAAESLASVGGDESVTALIVGLEDPMDNVRLAAVRGVRQLDPATAIPQLSRLLLEDPIWEIRVQAARALGSTGDPAVVAVLQSALEEENEFVSSAASNALRVHRALEDGDADEAARLRDAGGDGRP